MQTLSVAVDAVSFADEVLQPIFRAPQRHRSRCVLIPWAVLSAPFCLMSETSHRVLPLESWILEYFAAMWPGFRDLRSAASAHGQRDRLRNAISILVNDVRVAMAGAFLTAARRPSPVAWAWFESNFQGWSDLLQQRPKQRRVRFQYRCPVLGRSEGLSSMRFTCSWRRSVRVLSKRFIPLDIWTLAPTRRMTAASNLTRRALAQSATVSVNCRPLPDWLFEGGRRARLDQICGGRAYCGSGGRPSHPYPLGC